MSDEHESEHRHDRNQAVAPHWALCVTPSHTRARNGITGTTIAAAISAELRRPMPRYSIQSHHRHLIPAATTRSAASGTAKRWLRSRVQPRRGHEDPSAEIMPTAMAANICRK